MESYSYTAVSKGGEKVSGVVEAFNRLDAVDRIKAENSIVLSLKQINEEKQGLLNMEIGGKRLDKKAFTLMCSQFAIILRAGVPIGRTVHLIAEKMTNKALKKVLKKVAEDVESGRTLATSLEERGGKLFPPIFIETIRAGEESGDIAKAFESMHIHFDKMNKMKNKVKGALIYPAFVLAIAIVVVIVLMVKVVPVFIEIFESYGAELPLITRILVAISNFFRNYIIIILLVIAAIVIGLKIYSNTENGRLNMSKLALQLPVFGNINILNASSQFANSMCTMLSAGLPLVKCLNVTTKVITNYHIQQEVGKTSGKLEEGRKLGDSLRETGVLPDILVDMTAVGEETGELADTLRTVADYYDEELDVATKSALAKLEPAILIGLAGIAGFIVIAVYVAMFDMYGAM